MNGSTSSAEVREFMISTVAPGRWQKRCAVGFLLVLAAMTGVALCLGQVQLPRIDASIPAFPAAMLISDLLTAFLLFAQFSILRSLALIAISTGYLFRGLITVVWTLTFPGVFSADGLFGAGLQTTAGFTSFGTAASCCAASLTLY
jgi:hypothetical protein